MDISQEIKKLKKLPGFAEQVGMILIHNGTVRAWSRKREGLVKKLKVKPNYHLIEKLIQQYEQKPGIFKIIVNAKEGEFLPGDDLLFIIVAGDIREHVKPVLSELLDEIKSKAMDKTEVI